MKIALLYCLAVGLLYAGLAVNVAFLIPLTLEVAVVAWRLWLVTHHPSLYDYDEDEAP